MVNDEVLGLCLVEGERIPKRFPEPVSSDAKDQPPLMPNGLLLLRDSNGLAGCDGVEGKYLRRRKQINRLANTFWWR